MYTRESVYILCIYICVYAEYEIVHDSYDTYNVLNYNTPPSHFGGVKLVGAHN